MGLMEKPINPFKPFIMALKSRTIENARFLDAIFFGMYIAFILIKEVKYKCNQ